MPFHAIPLSVLLIIRLALAVASDVLLRHRRRCHPEAEAIREANAMIDSQAGGGSMPAPTVTSGRAKLKAAGLTKRSQGKSRQDGQTGSPEASLSPEVTLLNREMSVQLVHGPSPPSNTTSSELSGSFDQFFSTDNTSSNFTSLARSTPDSQSIVSLEAPSPSSFTDGGLVPAWASLPPLSMFNTANAILPKSGSEVTQFGGWYTFPQRRSRSGSANEGTSGNTVQDSETVTEDIPTDPLLESYLLGDTATAERLEADLLSPERTALNSECRFISQKRGAALDPSDKFYIPPGLFAGCYTIPHWLLPPLSRLSSFAARTLSEHLVRFPLVHQATFKLSESPHWLAFAMCTVGGLNPEEYKLKGLLGDTLGVKVASPPWDGVQGIVRTEKVDMLVKTFVRQSAKLPLCDQISIIQSLLLYNTPAFLSEEPSERIVGHLFLGTVVKVVRKSGLFLPSADYAMRLSVPADSTLDARWRKWIQHETSRRCAWFIYILDTIACLEAGIPSLISPRDVIHLAVPASESMWSARNEGEWAALAEAGGYHADGLTLDMAMESVFGFKNPTDGRPDAITGVRLGPFARTVVVMTLLRGLIEFGQGKPKGGLVTQCWVTEGLMAINGGSVDHDLVMSAYMRALAKWREGWDLDPLCVLLTAPQATSPSTSSMSSGSPATDGAPSPSSLDHITTGFFASTVDTVPRLKEPVFVNDALPYYWLALVLVDMLKPGVAACASHISNLQMQAQSATASPDPGVGSSTGQLDFENDPLAAGGMSGIGMNGMPYPYGFTNFTTGSARIVDLEEQNNKFAEVDFREMLTIAKDFARGDTGTMRSPSLAPVG
ncbi:Fungal specific transcription factor domain [Ceratobasidium sp. AG-Ba]|nr:Fungal specific transcription factor domain [Ceratobasidium sp. AG-Ba]